MASDETNADSKPKRGRYQYYLSHLLILLFVAAILLGLIRAVQLARQDAQKKTCENRLKMIGLALANYEASNGSLPPAYFTDAGGKPILSWRVRAAEYVWYDIDFSSQMDFSKPWNSPTNAAFLSPWLGDGFRCRASKAKQGTTHYVAVVGPGTLWPGSEPAKWPHPKGERSAESHDPILLVEWPESDIYWAEPRDVTVDEFVEWFRNPRRKTNHRGCILFIDTALEVRELPLDADPETVRELLMVNPSPAAPDQS